MMYDDTGAGFGVYAKETGREISLAMQELWLTGTVLPVGARLVVRHVFQSAEVDPLEVIYAFVLPRDAAMRSFRIVGKGFECHSELRPVVDAEEIYEVGVEEGHLSVMARTYRDGLVNLSVGNVRPDETVAVYLEIAAGVEAHDDGFRFRFPFTLAPSYHPRAGRSLSPDGVGEVSLPAREFGDVVLPPWRPDAENLHRVGFDLNVDIPDLDLCVASPSHPIGVLDRGRKITLAVEGDVPDRDLVLDVLYNEVKPIILAGTDSTGKGRLTAIVPSTCFGDAEGMPRRTVFLIDRSGSMDGKPMQQALKATEACLGALTEADRFGIVAFDSATEMLAPKLLRATKKNRDAAKRFLANIDARGGTELDAGVACAGKILGRSGGDIVVLTDGQVFGGEDILARLRRMDVRLHCLGIGSASQDRFLTLMARATGGVSRFVTPRERVDMALLEVFASTGAPVGEGINCQPSGGLHVYLAPEPARLAYRGMPLVMMGSFDGADQESLQIGWKNTAGEHTLALPVVRGQETLGEALRALQGARLIADVESQAAERQDDFGGRFGGRRGARKQDAKNPLEAALIALSAEYGLANRAMALVAVVKREGDHSGHLPRTRVVPVGVPQDTYFQNPAIDFQARSGSAEPERYMKCQMKRAPLSGALEDSWDMDIMPAFLGRSRREPAVARASADDLLIDLAAAIEPDGGAPGGDVEGRVAATLLVLLLFHASGHSSGAGAFSAHVRRLKTYLEGATLDELPETRRVLVQVLLTQLGALKTVSGPWETCARDYARAKERWSSAIFWEAAERAADAVRPA